MNLTETSLRNPAGVLVAILMVALLGIFALVKLPIQLFPNIEEPVISIFTSWRAAAPTEIESEIIEPQERALAGMRGMQSLNAFANAGSAFLNLKFAVGTDMQATMLEVISRMNQLPPLPRDAQAPQISLGEDGGNGFNNTLSWFFVQLLPGTPGPIDNYRRQIEELFRSRIESIPGVSNVRINFGSDEELQIVFDPARAAELGIQIPRIAQVAGSADDVSGGFVDIGRRQYTMRFAGRYSMDQFPAISSCACGAGSLRCPSPVAKNRRRVPTRPNVFPASGPDSACAAVWTMSPVSVGRPVSGAKTVRMS